MSDEERNTPRVALSVAVLIVLPVLYVLSSGPAAWLLGDSDSALAIWNFTYRPVGLLAERTGTGGLYGGYVNWWIR